MQKCIYTTIIMMSATRKQGYLTHFTNPNLKEKIYPKNCLIYSKKYFCYTLGQIHVKMQKCINTTKIIMSATRKQGYLTHFTKPNLKERDYPKNCLIYSKKYFYYTLGQILTERKRKFLYSRMKFLYPIILCDGCCFSLFIELSIDFLPKEQVSCPYISPSPLT